MKHFQARKIVFQKKWQLPCVAGEIDTPSLLSEVLRGNMHLFFHFSQQNVSVCMVDTIRTEILNEVVQL